MVGRRVMVVVVRLLVVSVTGLGSESSLPQAAAMPATPNAASATARILVFRLCLFIIIVMSYPFVYSFTTISILWSPCPSELDFACFIPRFIQRKTPPSGSL